MDDHGTARSRVVARELERNITRHIIIFSRVWRTLAQLRADAAAPVRADVCVAAARVIECSVAKGILWRHPNVAENNSIRAETRATFRDGVLAQTRSASAYASVSYYHSGAMRQCPLPEFARALTIAHFAGVPGCAEMRDGDYIGDCHGGRWTYGTFDVIAMTILMIPAGEWRASIGHYFKQKCNHRGLGPANYALAAFVRYRCRRHEEDHTFARLPTLCHATARKWISETLPEDEADDPSIITALAAEPLLYRIMCERRNSAAARDAWQRNMARAVAARIPIVPVADPRDRARFCEFYDLVFAPLRGCDRRRAPGMRVAEALAIARRFRAAFVPFYGARLIDGIIARSIPVTTL